MKATTVFAAVVIGLSTVLSLSLSFFSLFLQNVRTARRVTHPPPRLRQTVPGGRR